MIENDGESFLLFSILNGLTFHFPQGYSKGIIILPQPNISHHNSI